jgi:hypothetical protein
MLPINRHEIAPSGFAENFVKMGQGAFDLGVRQSVKNVFAFPPRGHQTLLTQHTELL